MSKEEIIKLIKEKIAETEEEMVEAQKLAGTRSAGWNQYLGYRDALVDLLNEIEGD